MELEMRSPRALLAAALAIAALLALAGSAQAAAPSNDDFANAITLRGWSGTQSGSSVGANGEAGEPNNHDAECCEVDDLGNTSVWYDWTAPASGLVGFDTITGTSSFDSVLGVYTGELGSLQEIEFNDDYGGVCCTSRFVFNAEAGETYKIAVGGCCGVPDSGTSDQGAFTLTWGAATRPANDDFASAKPIAGISGTELGGNFDASDERGELANHFDGGDLGGDSVWYSWTAPASGRYAFSAPGTTFNGVGTFEAVIGAYTGDLSALTEVGFGTRSLGLDATAGTTYTIGVGGLSNRSVLTHTYWGDMGSFSLTWAPDEIAPETTITSASGGKQSLTYSFTGTDNLTPAALLRFECKLDAGAFAPCKSAKTIAPIAGGRHSVQVRAIDQAGNVDPSPAVREIRVKGGSIKGTALARAANRRVKAARAARLNATQPLRVKGHPKG